VSGAFSVAALLLVTGTAHARAVPAQRQTVRHFNFLPPAEYDKPYTGELLIVRVATEQDVQAICKGSSKYACAAKLPGPNPRCQIFMLPDKQLRTLLHGDAVAFMLRHELGHCNGWPADHPNKRKTYMDTRIDMPTMPAIVKELPVSPPVVCVTPDWKSEPCESRKATAWQVEVDRRAKQSPNTETYEGLWRWCREHPNTVATECKEL
jgi:hypothetical protein